jgi:hypothetical protein
MARCVISAVLLWHLLATFWAPFNFASAGQGGEPSPLAAGLMNVFRPYVAMMYLDHGYFFFAPDPGASYLVRYRVEYDDGRQPVEGVFPNLKEQQPRLLYHRYFMVSTALNNIYTPPDPPPEPSPPPINATSSRDQEAYQLALQAYRVQYQVWKHRRDQYVALRDSILTHLQSEYPGGKVTITRVEHRPASVEEVERGKLRLDDPSTYRDLPETVGGQP